MLMMLRANGERRWWAVGLTLGAVVMYLVGALLQIANRNGLDTIVWPPFILLMAVFGAVLGLLTEGIRKLAGGRGWAVALSLCLFPVLMMAYGLILTSQTPGMEFRWHDVHPFALLVELFVVAYWFTRGRLLSPGATD